MSLVLTKALGRPAKTAQDNALNQLGMASTIRLILCCAMAYGLFLLKPVLFFPTMMAAIGSRYLVFASIYGRLVCRVMGAVLLAAACLCFFIGAAPVVAASLGGLIEVLFALLVAQKAGRPVGETRSPQSAH